METVRDFVARLTPMTSPDARPTVRHRRIVVPRATQFSLQRTILRVASARPNDMIKRPGNPPEVWQLLEWLDLEGGDGTDTRENDLGVDLTAVLSLASGRKVAYANEVPIRYAEADWTWFLELGWAFDGELYGPVEVDIRAQFIKIVKALVALPEATALSLGSAIRMRNAACCLVESDHSSAYGLLVAAIETLSRQLGDPPSSWNEWDQAEEWDKLFIELALSDEATTKLRQKLLANKQLRLRRTFIEYASGNLPNSFWQEEYVHFVPSVEMVTSGVRPLEDVPRHVIPISVLVPRDGKELRKRLGRSYDARSKVFHESMRLDQIDVMPLPGRPNEPLPFSGLRRILDGLLWHEIGKVADGAPDLPDVKLFDSAPDLPNPTEGSTD